MKEELNHYSKSCIWEGHCAKVVLPSKLSEELGFFYLTHNNYHLWTLGVPDSQLLLDTYVKNGAILNDRHAVDGSWLLFDENNSIVFASRDALGKYPLYYYQSPVFKEKMYFGFDFSDMIAIDGLKLVGNNRRIIDYLNGDKFLTNLTFVQGIFRIGPGRRHIFKKGLLAESLVHFQLEPARFACATDQELVEKLVTTFSSSVNKLIKKGDKIAATLSGGLDSSSVVCTAQNSQSLPVSTFNFEIPGDHNSEKKYIDAVVDEYPIVHRTLQLQMNPYEATKKIIEIIGCPPSEFNPYAVEIARIAEGIEASVMLTGHQGDAVLSHGTQRLAQLFDTCRYSEFVEAVKAHIRNYPLPAIQSGMTRVERNSFKKKFIIEFVVSHLNLRNKWRNIPGAVKILTFDLGCSVKDWTSFLMKKMSRLPHRGLKIGSRIVAGKLHGYRNLTSSKAEVFDPCTLTSSELDKYQMRHLRNIFRPSFLFSRDDYCSLYAAFGLRNGQPFFDRDLIELCLAIPEKLKFGNGLNRSIFRDAMAGIVPDEILVRNSKAEFGEFHIKNLAIANEHFCEDFPPDHKIWTWIDKTTFDKVSKILFDKSISSSYKREHVMVFERCVRLGLWLQFMDKNYPDFEMLEK